MSVSTVMSKSTVQAMPLARKYRPRSFVDLVGQKTVATALQKAIELQRIPQAILLTGVRGIGKTTTARLFAKSVVCQNGPSIDPCGECISCKSIEADRHPDVLEMDGASNTGVDDARRIIESVNYNPQMSDYKVYIIDEVHMLSNSAFNALLKTLEEPPPKVVFIFATTELQKVPDTIISRCQLFRLEKFQSLEIINRLSNILQKEAIAFDEAALKDIASVSGGSMRDALMLLDQVIAVGGGSVTIAGTAQVTGTVSSEICLGFLQQLLAKNPEAVMQTISDAASCGVKWVKICEQTLELCRHVFALPHLGDRAKEELKQELSPEVFAQLESLGKYNKGFDSNRLFRSLNRVRLQFTGDRTDKLLMENAGIEWCLDPGLPHFQKAGATSSPKPVVRAPAQTQPQQPQVQKTPQPVQGEQGQFQKQEQPQQAEQPSQRNLMGEFQKKMDSAPGQKKNSKHVEPSSVGLNPLNEPAKADAKMDQLRKIVEALRSDHPVLAKHLEYGFYIPQKEGSALIRLPKDSIHAKAFMANPGWLGHVQQASPEVHIELDLAEKPGKQDTTLRTILSDERQVAEAKRIEDCIHSPGVVAAAKTFGAQAIHIELPK